MLRFVLLLLVALGAIALFSGTRDDGAAIHFDAREPSKLERWVAKYHGSGYEEIAFVDGTLSMQSTSTADIDKIFDAGSQTEKILKAYSKAAENKSALKIIKITYRTELVDRYRNSLGIQPIITLRFDAAEAMRYNFERATAFEMVDTGSIEFVHPVERDAAKRYCERNGRFSRAFCTRYWPSYLLKQE